MTILFVLVGQALLGWLLADFLTGVAHWFEDRVMQPTWRIVGKVVVEANLLHHRDPMAFTRTGFLDRNWTTWVATLLVAMPLFLLFGFSLLLAVATLGGMCANQVHYWTHRVGPQPAWLKAAQATGALQSRRGHLAHHRPPQTQSYCALSDWLNPWLDASGVWHRLDRLFGVTDR